MKKSHIIHYLVMAFIVACGFCLIIAIIGGFFMIRNNQQARIDNQPPEVFITNPDSGTIFPTGINLITTATIISYHPITEYELWLDGVLFENNANTQKSKSPAINISFTFELQEGLHTIYVKAINENGVSGQSLPIYVKGYSAVDVENPKYLVHVENEGAMDNLVADLGIPAEEIIKQSPTGSSVNPGSGMDVIIPIPLEEGSKSPGQGTPPVNMTSFVSDSKILNIKTIPVFNFLIPKPPSAPGELVGGLENCWVKLQWQDNSENEAGFRIWRSSPISIPVKVVELEPSKGTGLVEYQFAVPYSGIFNIWVDAINPGGSQASNLISIDAKKQCPNYNPAKLDIKVVDFRTDAPIQKQYCYITVEEYPPTRFPYQQDQFNENVLGKWNIIQDQYNIEIPKDNILDLRGECLGWQGDVLVNLGSFSAKINDEAWNGKISTMDGGKYQIDVKVSLQGSNEDLPSISDPGTIASETGKVDSGIIDPSIPKPFNVHQERYGSEGGSTSAYDEYQWFWARTLKWKWNGKPEEITGFGIFMNGKLYKVVSGSGAREVQVKLPATCGSSLNWEVSALNGDVRSEMGEKVMEVLPPCKTYVKVEFESLYVRCTSDGWAPPCEKEKIRNDTLELYYTLQAGSLTKQFYGGNFYFPLKQGLWTFDQLGEFYVAGGKISSADTFIIPINSDTDANFDIAVSMWDYDDVTENDKLISFIRHFTTYSQDGLVVNSDGSGKDCKFFKFTEYEANADIEATLNYSYTIYPNDCSKE